MTKKLMSFGVYEFMSWLPTVVGNSGSAIAASPSPLPSPSGRGGNFGTRLEFIDHGLNPVVGFFQSATGNRQS